MEFGSTGVGNCPQLDERECPLPFEKSFEYLRFLASNLRIHIAHSLKLVHLLQKFDKFYRVEKYGAFILLSFTEEP